MWIMFTMESPGSRRRLGTLPTDGVSAGIRPDVAGRGVPRGRRHRSSCVTMPKAVPGPRRGSAETVLHFPNMPIYAYLSLLWREAGRSVPGQPDPEWDALVADSGMWGTGDGQPSTAGGADAAAMGEQDH